MSHEEPRVRTLPTSSGRCSSNPGRFRQTLGETRPALADVGQIWTTMGIRLDSVDICQRPSNFLPVSATQLGHLGQSWPNLVRIWAPGATVGPATAEKRGVTVSRALGVFVNGRLVGRAGGRGGGRADVFLRNTLNSAHNFGFRWGGPWTSNWRNFGLVLIRGL